MLDSSVKLSKYMQNQIMPYLWDRVKISSCDRMVAVRDTCTCTSPTRILSYEGSNDGAYFICKLIDICDI